MAFHQEVQKLNFVPFVTLPSMLTDAMYMCGARSLGDITRDMVREVR